MVRGRFTSPFAPLVLSLDEKDHLVRMADAILSETMALYERFLWQDEGKLDPVTWEHVREHEHTRVYRNRRAGAGTGNKDMQLLLTVGSVVGTFHDAMYGCLGATTEALRINSAYTKDTLLDMCVLESIVQPTAQAPFESMVVRYSVKGVPLHARLVAKHQDAVYIEMSGMRQLSNGERVGVHLSHSVAFDKTPALPQYDRTNLSICDIWRPAATGRVHSFVTSYFEIKESFMTSMIMGSLADSMLAVGNVIECALLKKLAWLVHHKGVLGGSHTTTDDNGCSVCGSHHRSSRQGIKSACAVCAKDTCKKCRVKRTLSLVAPDGQLVEHEMRFCVPCISSATKLDAAAVAIDDATVGPQEYNGDSYTISSSASSSSSQSGDDLRFTGRDDASRKRSTEAPNASRGSDRSLNAA